MTKYLIYKAKYDAYYRPKNSGYTKLKEDAGRYDLDSRANDEFLKFIPEDEAKECLGRDSRLEYLERRMEETESILDSIGWVSCDKDNMEFQANITCFTMDKIRELKNKLK